MYTFQSVLSSVIIIVYLLSKSKFIIPTFTFIVCNNTLLYVNTVTLVVVITFLNSFVTSTCTSLVSLW